MSRGTTMVAYDRDLGIRAIQALQAVAGIDEPYEKAAKGWDGMSVNQRLQTTLAHLIVCGGFTDTTNEEKEVE